MRNLPSILCIVCVVALLQGPVRAADDVSALGLLQPIDLLVASANSGLSSGVVAAYVPAPTIVDEFTPFRWSGSQASSRWLHDFGVATKSEGMTRLNLQRHAPSYMRVSGNRAWVIVPMDLTFYMKSKRQKEEGAWTFVLAWVGRAWHIESSSWAQTSDMVALE
ncbi:MAG: hypothetical protein IAI50_14625 [Candidatus Eremiobacteraeota bacterium]|nr:hypothetical protein [Candidatus Eremiobacteraeota bacterium]